MLKIAICEDDPKASELCRSHIERFEHENGLPLSQEDGNFGFWGLKNRRGNGKILPIDSNRQKGNRGKQKNVNGLLTLPRGKADDCRPFCDPEFKAARNLRRSFGLESLGMPERRDEIPLCGNGHIEESFIMNVGSRRKRNHVALEQS